MKTKMSTKNKVLIAGAIFVVLVLAFVGLYFAFMPKGTAGEKAIEVSVYVGDELKNTYSYDTDEEFLGAVLQKEGLIEGDVGDYGLFITAVDGIEADSSKEQWWSITQDGEMTATGADTTPIADGDHFELTLVEGYDS